nr:MAG TPA: homing endonuclease [Caudoviricetes sp.]
MKEFRKIPSLKFLYEVSKNGEIRNIKSKKIKSQYTGTDGYKYISIESPSITGEKNKSKHYSVHRLVAECWCNPPDNWKELEVNHKDENITNNNASNLEWCTHDYNVHYGTAIKRSALSNQKYEYYMDDKLIGLLDDCVNIILKDKTSKKETIKKHILQATNGYKNSNYAYGHYWKRIIKI